MGSAPRTRVGFVAGIGALVEALGFVVGTPAVWPLAVVPVVVALVLVAGFSVLGVWGAVTLTERLFTVSGGALEAIGAWALRILLGALAVLAGALVAMSLAQPLSGIALERLARIQERRLGGREWPDERLLSSMARSARVTFTALAFGLPLLALLAAVTVLVPPASVVTVPLKFLVTALMIAWDFLDYPLSVRGMSVGARLRFIGAHLAAVLGFGLASAFLLLVPGIGLLLLPVGVAGATRLVLAAER